MKSWSVPQVDGNAWRFRGLTEKQFNILAGPQTVPTFLFLVVVPQNPRNYTRADAQRLQIHYAAYWVSFEGQPKFPDPSGDRHVPVTVPQENLLTVDSLTALCEGCFASQDGARVRFVRTP